MPNPLAARLRQINRDPTLAGTVVFLILALLVDRDDAAITQTHLLVPAWVAAVVISPCQYADDQN